MTLIKGHAIYQKCAGCFDGLSRKAGRDHLGIAACGTPLFLATTPRVLYARPSRGSCSHRTNTVLPELSSPSYRSLNRAFGRGEWLQKIPCEIVVKRPLERQAPAFAAAGRKLRQKCTRPKGGDACPSAPGTGGSSGERSLFCRNTSRLIRRGLTRNPCPQELSDGVK